MPTLPRRAILKSAFGIPFILGAGWRVAEKPKIALIGCGGMGNGDASNAKRFGAIAAVCDVDATRAETTAKKFEGAKAYHDFRKLLDAEKDISVIINATPDHWHTLVNLAALKAGKDIYSEKPLTLTIDEGKRLVQAVKDSKRILQTGSQQRSDKLFRQACLLIRAGRLGKLSTVTSTLPAGLHGGPFKPSPVPKGLDWDMWQGQTQEVEFVTERCFTNFRFWREYSGGSITDWGAHHNDIVLWATGKDRSGPTSVEGKRLVEPIPGGYTTVPEYEVTFTYADGLTHVCKSTTASTIFGSPSNKPVPRSQMAHGVKFEGADGWLFVTRGKIEASRPEMLKDKLSAEELKVYVSDDHMKNFFDCVESRKAPICEAEIGHRSATVCHLGGIALQLGRKLTWDPAKEEFVGDKEANSYVAREQRKKWSYEAT